MSITDPSVGLMCVSPDEMQHLRSLEYKYERLREQQQSLKVLVSKGEMMKSAFIHILHDLNMLNKQLSSQRKAMIHILADYEQDRRRLAQQTESLDNSRRALLHILQDSHHSNLRLEKSRKAMIHMRTILARVLCSGSSFLPPSRDKSL